MQIQLFFLIFSSSVGIIFRRIVLEPIKTAFIVFSKTINLKKNSSGQEY